MKQKLISWIFGTVIKKATPYIITFAATELRKVLEKLKAEADKTPNPYDNIFVELLEAILKATAKE